ncbi:hypothetical protein F441_13989 [Phytophthora nicotianae CJ01A1]|uniref:Uncharacterized protein n=6 Tax=Phytophthora nicotianae TaxID=4792 RepID=W2PXT2_PHYN3|nr:hypothetical protein PPTG_23533 [Phytophthora nicotianae INRA-310]ETI40585.1 hypothetical protein F443_14063 [Phytophthora nicotianae P1569]ETK80683.1 hypothetical protein L915_13706 [Phytophthora nicotianae]ETO69290.1 hypothetical protein F444_14094 [Phytophthora nicotianae P1976]ETP10340.1 hypothetical protein F441_13989 [Phytophthora nicotianae CJ01A1]ETP38502.1 hypothetical protein F442_13906 [Phytophthora nicotianae P10297]
MANGPNMLATSDDANRLGLLDVNATASMLERSALGNTHDLKDPLPLH